MSEHQYIQVPPDSTGKKIYHRVEVLLLYENGVGDIAVGDRVIGATSGALGDVTYKSGTTTSGEIHILLTSQSVVDFINGEDLTVETVKKAEANGTGSAIYVPSSMIISGNNTENHANIDDDGGLYIRYNGGNPALDITGRQEVVNPVTIADYAFKYETTMMTEISMTADGTASYTYLPGQNVYRLRVQTSTGDKVVFQSHKYHLIPNGIAYGIIFDLWVGDTGKENCRRRWGMFDDDDGYFFESNGTALNTVWRTSVSGSLVEYRVPQLAWNLDTLDGSSDLGNPSKLSLDISKNNIYFMESAGNGGTTLGVYLNGKRIRVHAFAYAGYFSGTAVQKSNNLPVRCEIENTGETASTSEFYLTSMTVLANTTKSSLYGNRKGLGSLRTGTKSVSSDWQHMFSIRPVKTFDGEDNRAWIFPYLTKFVSDTAPVEYVVSIAPNAEAEGVDDGSWTPQSLAEYSIDSTNATPFNMAAIEFGGSNEAITCNHIREGLSPSEAKLIRYANINQSPMTVSVYCRSLGAATNVTMSFTWMELY